jgi:hypothetical protein
MSSEVSFLNGNVEFLLGTVFNRSFNCLPDAQNFFFNLHKKLP